jgi:hypothetical protein
MLASANPSTSTLEARNVDSQDKEIVGAGLSDTVVGHKAEDPQIDPFRVVWKEGDPANPQASFRTTSRLFVVLTSQLELV